MRKIVFVLLLCVATGFALRAGIANAVREAEGLPAKSSQTSQSSQMTSTEEVESDLDRILSGEEALPVLNERAVSADMRDGMHRVRVWMHKQGDAFFTFLIASGVSILIGVALALFIRHLVTRNDAEKKRMRWQVVAALSGPVILLLVSGAIFLFLLPILHSLPMLYPIEARLFFTWVTLLAAWAGFQVIALFDIRLRSFAQRPDSTLDSLMVDITRKLLKIVISIVTVLFIGQSIFQLNITTLLAGAGVAGLAVAFASRETLANFFGTMVIILDRPFRIGDRIKAGDINGIVISVGMRKRAARNSPPTRREGCGWYSTRGSSPSEKCTAKRRFRWGIAGKAKSSLKSASKTRRCSTASLSGFGTDRANSFSSRPPEQPLSREKISSGFRSGTDCSAAVGEIQKSSTGKSIGRSTSPGSRSASKRAAASAGSGSVKSGFSRKENGKRSRPRRSSSSTTARNSRSPAPKRG